jgi:DMSO/TMAO reductase YedYZ heme-binding membrane subunit
VLHGLTDAKREAVAEPLAEAFASTFVWGLALLALAFIPALAMALGKWKQAPPPSASERPAMALD